MKPLNPELYEALKRAFPGGVRVSGEGIPFSGQVEVDPADNRRKRAVVLQAGEYYCVCCPYCKDTRYRLWINHRWMTKLVHNRNVVTLRHLAVCYNEHCEANEDFRDDMRARLARGGMIKHNQVIQSDDKPTPLKPLELAGKYIRLDRLPKQHAAVQYIEKVRGMSAEELGLVWDVMWFEYSPMLPQNNRLFFPYYTLDEESGERILVGGQAHWLDVQTLNGTPPKGSGEVKWFTLPGTRASQCLFNGWRASKQSKLVVIVEGPFDAAVLGPEFSVALFGHTVSHKQKQILMDNWGSKDGAAVLALDPDVAHEKGVIELENWFKGWKHHTVLRLPDNNDIGDYKRDEAWTIIAKTGILNHL